MNFNPKMEMTEENYELVNFYKKLYSDMALFGRTCFPSALSKEIPKFHHEIYKALLRPELRRILIAAPRGSAKSTIDSLIYPAFRVAFKSADEDIFIVIISESQAQAVNFLSRLKYHLSTSKNFKALFGDLGENTAKRWTNDDIILANGARIIAIGTGQRLRGFIEKDVRPTDIIVDDFESEHNAVTAEARTKNRLWMQNAVVPSLNDGGRVLFVGTPISEDCFMYWARGDIDNNTQERETPWHVMWYSICEDLDKLYSEPENLKNLLWPEKFPASRIKEIIAEHEVLCNMNGFFQEYMCIAQDPGTAIFKSEYIKYHDFQLVYKRGVSHLSMTTLTGEQVLKQVTVYHGVDPASSLADTADYFVNAALAIDEEENIYIVMVDRGRYEPADQPDILIKNWEQCPGRRMKIETVAYQEALRSFMKRRMDETGKHIPGLESGVKPRTKKSQRLISLAPKLKAGKFFFRRDRDREAVKEFLSYPRGKNDDIMDAIWFALDGAKFVKQRSGAPESEEQRKKLKGTSWRVA